ncbi:MAG: hypothetical protein P1Q69_08190 [Candidatus Thorarchaeota archaeon]|nr:hypothetical protein [Candidatus Thorarchaeota archaeon]
MIERTLSRSILPVGGWPLIDGFYQDTSALDGKWDVYYAYQEGGSFIFGYHSFDFDLDVSYESHVSYSTGLPITAFYHRIHGVDSDHTIMLEQLDT